MPRKPDPEVDLEEEIAEAEGEREEGKPMQADDTPFDPWGTEKEEADRRRDPLRSPVA